MVELYDIDISGLLGETIQSVGGLEDGVLIKTRSVVNPNDMDDVSQVATEHAFQGTYQIRETQGADLVPVSQSVVTISAYTLPSGIEPREGDQIRMRGNTFTIERYNADPALAEYQCILK